MARREALIAPVVMEAIGLTSATLRFEYVLKVDERLQGKIDYFVRAKHHVLIIEAKNGDPEGAFQATRARDGRPRPMARGVRRPVALRGGVDR